MASLVLAQAVPIDGPARVYDSQVGEEQPITESPYYWFYGELPVQERRRKQEAEKQAATLAKARAAGGARSAREHSNLRLLNDLQGIQERLRQTSGSPVANSRPMTAR